MRKRSWQEVLRGVIKMATKVLKYLAPFGDFFFFSSCTSSLGLTY